MYVYTYHQNPVKRSEIPSTGTGRRQALSGTTIFSDTSDQNTLFYDSLAAQPLTLADSLRLLSGMLDTYRVQLTDMGVQVASLQTRLASDDRNDIALALQNLTNTLNVVTNVDSLPRQPLRRLRHPLPPGPNTDRPAPASILRETGIYRRGW